MCENFMKISMGVVEETHVEDEAKNYVSLKEEEEEEEGEESGWTSYLDTESSINSSNIESSAYNCSSNFIHHGNYNRTTSPLCCNHSNNNNNNCCYNYMIDEYCQIVAQNGNISDMEEGGFREAAFPDQESLGSSTLSEASSNLGQSNRNCADFLKYSRRRVVPIKSCTLPPQNEQRFKRNRRKFGHFSADFVPLDHHQDLLLQDTASSSPASSLAQHSANGSAARSFSEANIFLNGDGDVSKRFKALEALIPHLKEVAGKTNEEEMLNVIISHVQNLELKVELLSNVWRLSRLKRQ